MADSDPQNFRSRTITEGPERTPNRAMLRAVGFGDGDFAKPIVGVASAYSTITPCNVGLNALADRAVEALRAAGAMPQLFGTITVSDGISMGTEGMKYSLVSREVIADSIETACNAQSMDGVLVVGGCDKNIPGAMIAIARMNIPAVFVYGGTTRPGRLNGKDLTVVSAFEAVGGIQREEDQREPAPRCGTKCLSRRRFLRGNVHREYHVVGHRSYGAQSYAFLHDGRRGQGKI